MGEKDKFQMKCNICKKNIGKIEDKNYAFLSLYIVIKQRKLLKPMNNLICLDCAKELIKQFKIESLKDIKFLFEVDCCKKIEGFYRHIYTDKKI